MTQVEARNAVQRIHDRLEDIYAHSGEPGRDEQATDNIPSILYDLRELAKEFGVKRIVTPNCRPATAAELSALCASSNVVIFPPAA